MSAGNKEPTKHNEEGCGYDPHPLQSVRRKEFNGAPISLAKAMGQVARHERPESPDSNEDRNCRTDIEKPETIIHTRSVMRRQSVN
jgi:hypothetical protein